LLQVGVPNIAAFVDGAVVRLQLGLGSIHRPTWMTQPDASRPSGSNSAQTTGTRCEWSAQLSDQNFLTRGAASFHARRLGLRSHARRTFGSISSQRRPG